MSVKLAVIGGRIDIHVDAHNRDSGMSTADGEVDCDPRLSPRHRRPLLWLPEMKAPVLILPAFAAGVRRRC